MDEPTEKTRVLLPIPRSVTIGLTIAVTGTSLFSAFASPWFASISEIVVASAGRG